MNAMFFILREGPDLLVLRYRFGSRCLVGIVCSGIGSAILFVVFCNPVYLARLHAGHVGEIFLAMLGLLMVLFGMNTLLNDKHIHVDRQRQQLEIEGRIFGLWPRRSTISFSNIESVRVVKRFDDYAVPYWSLEIAPRQGMGRVLDASSDSAYIERAAHAMETILETPISREEFSTQASRKRPTATS